MSKLLTRPIGTGTLLTFDCYGTLIDWESGILAGIRAAYPPAADVSNEALLGQFHSVQNKLKTSQYRPYRDLLTEVAATVAETHGWAGGRERAAMIPASIPSWLPFDDTNDALRRLDAAGVSVGILSNIDNDLLTETLKRFEIGFALLGTAQNLQSYKPAEPHFSRGREWAGEYEAWVHVAQSLFHDVVPATALGIPTVWVNRKSEPTPDDAKPIHIASDLASAAEWLLSP